FFCFRFRPAVNVKRVDGVFGLIGSVALAVKNVVSTQEEQLGAGSARRPGHVHCAHAIDLMCALWVLFTTIHVGVRRSQARPLWPVARKEALKLRRITHVSMARADACDFIAVPLLQQDFSQQSCCPDHQDAHSSYLCWISQSYPMSG